MLRLTITLAVLVAMLATSNELMAQRRTPLRNMARQIGVRWSSGYHHQNPGPISDYYSPWSETNTPDHQNHSGTDATPGANSYFDEAPANSATGIENSATRLLRQTQPFVAGTGSQSRIWNAPRTQPDTSHSIETTWQQNQEINRSLKPWHNNRTPAVQNRPNTSSGQFIPTRNATESNYDRQFENSRPFVPGSSR